jgi:LmbE family N-acetylglucosaminyl deacetylase
VTPEGTPESVWAGWPVLQTLPTLDPPAGQLLVISAHPDDEVLGAGGLLATMAASDSPAPRFVTVTDGEASHPVAPSQLGRDLGSRRAVEVTDSLRALGHSAPQITRLQLPDSAVADHVDRLACQLERIVGTADLVLCPARSDGHIDHATVGEVTVEVCADLVQVWEFPIWVWHWTRPGDLGIPWDRAKRFEIGPEVVRRKQRALACFLSQIAPLPGDDTQSVVLPPDVLEHFGRPYEVFFT